MANSKKDPFDDLTSGKKGNLRNQDIEAYIHVDMQMSEKQRSTLLFLHQLLMTFPELTAKIRYKIPFYYRKSWICYLNPVKGEGIEFAFTRGNELSNEQGLLDFRGRKQIGGVIFRSDDDIPVEVLMEVLQEALVLDEEVAYNVRKKKNK